MDYTTLAAMIAGSFASLSPQLRVAARKVLERPDDVALMSMRGFASTVGVHPSTMTRLARHFEFDSYKDFQESFQRRLRAHPGDFASRARELQARGVRQSETVLKDVLDAAARNMGESFDANGPEKFTACAEILLKAPRIFCLGRRSCFPVAFYFRYLVSVLRDGVRLLDGLGGTFTDELRELRRDDVVFVVGFEPYSNATVDAIAVANELGCTVISLTDTVVSPIASSPDRTILVRNESPSFFHSVAPALAAVEALAAIMVLRGGAKTLATIAASEKQMQRFSAYWQGAAGGRPSRMEQQR